MKNIITFRLDDITPGLRKENFKRFESIFDTFDIKPLIGVVPKNEDPKLMVEPANEGFWDDILRLQEKGWIIAMHGYRHVYSNECEGILKANPFSEFAGIGYEEQADMISRGKEIMASHGIKPTFFMAPGHTFDENTLRALTANGIYNVTDGYAHVPYTRDRINFYPCTLSDPKVKHGIDTVCMHPNNWSDDDFSDLESFIRKNRSLCMSFGDMISEVKPVEYDDAIAKQEERHRRNKAEKQKLSQNDKMQDYLKKSYSENKILKFFKRCFYLPMLLKK
ncbi:MAG: DUF2334 domain-containing protein [Lachnospiraceae bacterium]|nr:DUF2334 domain-containing protein [Lachnospiraceae bacterium]